jgi:hypothetical protein
VLAVPAAWVVRLADGAWPVPPAGAAAAAPRLRGQPLSGDQKLFGIAAGVATVVNGALSGLGDALTGVSEGSLQVVSDLLFAPAMIAGVIGSFLAYPPLVDGPGATGYDWGAWGGAWFGLVAGFLTSVAGLAKPALATELGLTASVVTTVTSAVAFVLYLLEWFEADQPDDAVTRTALAANELSVGAGLLNLYKYLGDETYGIATAVVAGLDVFAALGAAACAWTVLGLTWDG